MKSEGIDSHESFTIYTHIDLFLVDLGSRVNLSVDLVQLSLVNRSSIVRFSQNRLLPNEFVFGLPLGRRELFPSLRTYSFSSLDLRVHFHFLY